jgi:hypothetical protein
MPLMLANLEEYVKETADDALHAGVGVLLDAIEAPMPLFAGCLPATAALAVHGAQCEGLDAETRCHCLQVCCLWPHICAARHLTSELAIMLLLARSEQRLLRADHQLVSCVQA